jgi:hypothetical protein
MTDLSTTLLATGSSPTHPERVRDKLGRLQMAPFRIGLLAPMSTATAKGPRAVADSVHAAMTDPPIRRLYDIAQSSVRLRSDPPVRPAPERRRRCTR